jgi:hypothetical protein
MTGRPGKIDWLGGLAYPLAVILMEACWVAPWLAWVGSWSVFGQPGPVLGLGTVVAALALSLLVTRLLQRSQWPLRLAQAAVIGAGLAVILLALGAEYRGGHEFLSGEWFAYFGRRLASTLSRPNTAVPALLALLYLWWRGIILGQATAAFRGVYRSFLFGMMALIVPLVIWRAGGSAGPGAGTGFYVMGFFFFGLLAIALNHLCLMRRSMPREEAALTPVRRWLPLMLGVIGGMVLVGFAVSGLLSPELFDTIGRGAGVFFGFLGRIINYILVPLSYVFEAVIWLFQLMVSWLRRGQPVQPGASGNPSFPEVTPVTLKGLPPVVAQIVLWLVIVLVAAAVVFVLAKAVSRWRGRGERDEIEEVHESLFSWKGLGDDLEQLLRAMGQRFKRTPRPSPAAWSEDEAWRLDIREIYRRLLREAALSGVPRRRPETPVEYAGRLGRLVPESAAPVSGLTELYSGVRYGETGLIDEQVDGANSLWRALRVVLRALREATG